MTAPLCHDSRLVQRAIRDKTLLLAPAARAGTPLPGGIGFVANIHRHKLSSVSIIPPTCLLVLEGTKVLATTDERVVIKNGHMYCIPPQGELHVENIPDASTGRYLAACISFSPHVVGAARAASTSLDIPPTAALAAMMDQPSLPLLKAMEHLLDMAMACPEDAALLDSCLLGVMLLLSRHRGGAMLLSCPRAPLKEQLALAVMGDPSRRWTAGEMACRLGTTERTLRRGLALENATFRRILQDSRLHAALGLLQQSDLAVGEVGLRCGYESPSKFSERFRERFGLPPSELRRVRGKSEQEQAGSGQPAS